MVFMMFNPVVVNFFWFHEDMSRVEAQAETTNVAALDNSFIGVSNHKII